MRVEGNSQYKTFLGKRGETHGPVGSGQKVPPGAGTGLLQGAQAPDGTRRYGEEALQRAVSFRFLQQAGMELGTLKHFARLAEQGSDTVGERLRLLRRCRCCLLEEIHQKQQALDQVDYLIRELRGK